MVNSACCTCSLTSPSSELLEWEFYRAGEQIGLRGEIFQHRPMEREIITETANGGPGLR